jgi:predicted  nucleic acid-binding Zn-ribbon protein
MKANEFITEKWSQKYKSSINCSHPKGFSQKAHCAGKKKHNESIEMEMVCEDCGMCKTHSNLNEIKKGAKDSNGYTRCWPGKHAEGTKKGKNGEQVRNCVPNESKELAEEFDLIESIIDQIAAQNGVDSEVVWDDLESLTEDELYAFAVTSQLNEDWQKVNKKDKTDGMSKKAVSAYRREHPGSKLKTAVTTKPSKLKKGSKASKRRKSYCSRSKGQMKMHNISCAKTPDKAICKARRRWNC